MTTTLRERITKARKAVIKPAVPQPTICLDCGIDLPTTWHWDGCTLDPRQAKVGQR